MDLSFSNDQENFRKEVRNFLKDNLKPNISSKMKLGILLSKDEIEYVADSIKQTLILLQSS